MGKRDCILTTFVLNSILFFCVILFILPLVLLSIGKVNLVQFKGIISFYALYLASTLTVYFLAMFIPITKKKPCDPKEYEMWKEITINWKKNSLLVGLIVFILSFAFFGILELFPYKSFGEKELFNTLLLSLTYSAVWVVSIHVFD